MTETIETTCLAGYPSGLDTSPLYRPLQVQRLVLPNRIVMSPMTRSFAPGGVLEPEMVDYYRLRVEGGVGLVVSEGTAVDHPVANYTSRIPNFYGEVALAQWRRVIEGVHAASGLMFPQLWHTGIGRLQEQTANPDELSIGPSVVGKKTVRPMTQKDIDDVIEAFATAAATAEKLGFDGVAIHGAHGYLIDQFFWQRTNRREDSYGGALENRIRFGVELIEEMRRRVAPDFPIMLRFSQWKGPDYDAKIAQTPQELAAILEPLARAGVDIFDASTRRFWLPEFEGSALSLAGWAKKLTGKISMAVGSVGLANPLDVKGNLEVVNQTAVTSANLAQLLEMMERGEFDLIGIGRILLTNPRWPILVREGRLSELHPYNAQRVYDMIEPGL
jgi:2,4-dienoyl-CoA reductase-like NADH-dependent reductase (Old Yellow Enzyme family)